MTVLHPFTPKYHHRYRLVLLVPVPVPLEELLPVPVPVALLPPELVPVPVPELLESRPGALYVESAGPAGAACLCANRAGDAQGRLSLGRVPAADQRHCTSDRSHRKPLQARQHGPREVPAEERGGNDRPGGNASGLQPKRVPGRVRFVHEH